MPRVDQMTMLFSIIEKCVALEEAINQARCELQLKDVLSCDCLDDSQDKVSGFRKMVVQKLINLMK